MKKIYTVAWMKIKNWFLAVKPPLGFSLLCDDSDVFRLFWELCNRSLNAGMSMTCGCVAPEKLQVYSFEEKFLRFKIRKNQATHSELSAAGAPSVPSPPWLRCSSAVGPTLLGRVCCPRGRRPHWSTCLRVPGAQRLCLSSSIQFSWASLVFWKLVLFVYPFKACRWNEKSKLNFKRRLDFSESLSRLY